MQWRDRLYEAEGARSRPAKEDGAERPGMISTTRRCTEVTLVEEDGSEAEVQTSPSRSGTQTRIASAKRRRQAAGDLLLVRRVLETRPAARLVREAQAQTATSVKAVAVAASVVQA